MFCVYKSYYIKFLPKKQFTYTMLLKSHATIIPTRLCSAYVLAVNVVVSIFYE